MAVFYYYQDDKWIGTMIHSLTVFFGNKFIILYGPIIHCPLYTDLVHVLQPKVSKKALSDIYMYTNVNIVGLIESNPAKCLFP